MFCKNWLIKLCIFCYICCFYGNTFVIQNTRQNYYDSCLNLSLYFGKRIYRYQKNPLIIILGPSCSGKTTFTKKLPYLFFDFPDQKQTMTLVDSVLQHDFCAEQIPSFPQNLREFVFIGLDERKAHVTFEKKCYSSLGMFSANRLIEKYRRISSLHVRSIVIQKLHDRMDSMPTITTHEHNLSGVLTLKIALELNLIKCNIIPYYKNASLKTLITRLVRRNALISNGKQPYFEYRSVIQVLAEYFEGLNATDAKSDIFLKRNDILKWIKSALSAQNVFLKSSNQFSDYELSSIDTIEKNRLNEILETAFGKRDECFFVYKYTGIIPLI